MKLNLNQIKELALEALIASGADRENALPLADAVASAEADAIASHGLRYIPIYCSHLKCGKVNGKARPVIQQPAPSVVQVDAKTGFAHPAIKMGFEILLPLAQKTGIAYMTVNNSYNCGVLGYHTEKLSQASKMIALGFTNAPASIAPVGKTNPTIGTNPFSLAIAGEKHPLLLIDQSTSVIAKSEVMAYARENKPLPEGWVLDPEGNPTTDANIGLAGTMVPFGGYKGFGIGLFVEIMAAALSNAQLSINAAPYSGEKGGPPKTGQCFIAIAPQHQEFQNQIDSLLLQLGDRIPGDRRFAHRELAEKNGVAVDETLVDKIRQLS